MYKSRDSFTSFLWFAPVRMNVGASHGIKTACTRSVHTQWFAFSGENKHSQSFRTHFWKPTGVICRTVNGIPRGKKLYLIGRRQLLLGIGSNLGNWSHLRLKPVQTPPVQAGANHGKPVNGLSDCPYWVLPYSSLSNAKMHRSIEHYNVADQERVAGITPLTV